MSEPTQQESFSTDQLLTRATRYRRLGVAMLIQALLNLVGGFFAYVYDEPLVTSACLVMSLAAAWLAKTSLRMSADAYRSVISS